jgi:hypothetical protein
VDDLECVQYFPIYFIGGLHQPKTKLLQLDMVIEKSHLLARLESRHANVREPLQQKAQILELFFEQLLSAALAMARQDKTRQDKTRQDKTRQDKTRQDKTRQDKARQGKARQGTTGAAHFERRDGSRMMRPLRKPHLHLSKVAVTLEG